MLVGRGDLAVANEEQRITPFSCSLSILAGRERTVWSLPLLASVLPP